jgi:hypothetical protein
VNEDSARQFMQTDPAVMAGLMSATLHPYAVSLQRQGERPSGALSFRLLSSRASP